MQVTHWLSKLSLRRRSKLRRSPAADPALLTHAVESLEDRTLLSSAPVLEAIADVEVLSGSPLIVPLSFSHPDGQTLTFSATSSNSDLTAEFPTGNRSLRIEVEHYGEMTFELLESHAPRVTDHMIELAESGFFDGIIFHRIIDGFVIQGGDPTGTGTGGSPLGDFDDQYHPDLQHNQGGMLSMAKSLDDTNDSQFFITEGPTRHLDSNHSIWGYITRGEDVREEISNVPTDSGDRPLNDVVMERVEVFVDTERGLMILKAPEGLSGEASVTVTATDEDGNSVSQTFQVTITPDASNSSPFLDETGEIRTEVDTPVTFTLTATDVEGDDFVFSNSPPNNADHTISLDSDTGEITVTPLNGFRGILEVDVSVQAVGGGPTDDQTLRIQVGPDLIMHEATANGDDTVTVTYEVVSEAVDEFLICFFRSGDATFEDGGDELLATLEITDPADRTVGMHMLTFTIGGGEGEVALPGAGAAETDDDYRILAVIDPDSRIEETDVDEFNEDNTVTMTGAYHLPGGPVFVHGSDDDDTASATPGSIDLNLDGDVVSYDEVDVTELRVRAHDGDDSFDARDIGVPVVAWGGAGDDTLGGGTAADTLRGGPGDDYLSGGADDDLLFGDDGTDRVVEHGDVDFALSNNQLTGMGTDALDDVEEADLSGGDGDNSMMAFSFSGKTTLDGGDGNDTLLGSPQTDQLTGGLGNDLIRGFGGKDLLVEQGDADITLNNVQMTGLGTDDVTQVHAARITGGDGDNIIDTEDFSGKVTLDGGNGNDSLGGGGFEDKLIGGDGDDTLNGRLGHDLLEGDDGIDRIFGGGGSDLIFAGKGNDTVKGQTGDDTVFGGDGDDQLKGDNGNDLLDGQIGNDSILGGDGSDTLLGDDGQDTLKGDADDDFLNGGKGHDTLEGRGGEDQMFGGAGNDLMIGGDGEDTINGQSGDDSLNGGDDDDSLIGGDGNDGLAGRGGDDHLNGGGDDDTLLGGEGNDSLFGGAKRDVLLGEAGIDNVIGQGGTDTVTGGGNGVDPDDDDNVVGEVIDDAFMFDAPWVNI